MVRRLGVRLSLAEKTSINKKRENLLTAIQKFEMQSERYLGEEIVLSETIPGAVIGDDEMYDSSGEEIPPLTESITHPEKVALTFPSSFLQSEESSEQFIILRRYELELRKGFANDLLHSIRESIGLKSLHFKKSLRSAAAKAPRTRARSTIAGIQKTVDHYKRCYDRNRQSMQQLGLTIVELENQYRPLLREDLHASTTMTAPNLPGQSRSRLSWIWTVDLDTAHSNSNHLTECQIFLIYC